jgi:hypothetical protein
MQLDTQRDMLGQSVAIAQITKAANLSRQTVLRHQG